ncbi:IclR family transcriptional regulator [Nitrospirillum sp. BR 11164]|uniref:IclR family transcriptional regulator n=1 Tax=Nitrospirillum sp. BR 11164 TaxID=3104324 RepID=UPI002AFE5D00|nr:IclR family transcriptional regulator [Nitrospirillum sp. BR 11164]MEA1651150.1 IclR family transcriptional regulator [Nitrospirillum sp. BR 11164]
MTRAGPKGTYAAPAIEKAFEILEMLAEHRDGALVSEMAAHLNRSVGELFRVVIVMEQLGYLQKSAKSDRYTAAYKLLDLAYRATPTQNLLNAALPEMRRLAIETGQSCHFVVPNGGEGLVIAREENPGTRGFSLRLGAAIDMLKSCSGQVILAFSKPEQADRIIAEAEAIQGVSADRDGLGQRLDTIRRDGFDHRKSPITHGVTDISYPVFGFDRDIAGALTIPFLALIDGSQKVDFETAQGLLRGAAGNISATLGYMPAKPDTAPSR